MSDERDELQRTYETSMTHCVSHFGDATGKTSYENDIGPELGVRMRETVRDAIGKCVIECAFAMGWSANKAYREQLESQLAAARERVKTDADVVSIRDYMTIVGLVGSTNMSDPHATSKQVKKLIDENKQLRQLAERSDSFKRLFDESDAENKRIVDAIGFDKGEHAFDPVVKIKQLRERAERAESKNTKLVAAFEAVRAEANLMRHAITLSDSSLDEERENIAQKQRDTDAALRKLEGE